MNVYLVVRHRQVLNYSAILVKKTAGRGRYILSRLNQRGLARVFSSNFKPTFYPCTQPRPRPRPIPEGALTCRWPADDCFVCYRTGGVKGDSYIVYDLYALTARWTVHAKIYSWRILLYL